MEKEQKEKLGNVIREKIKVQKKNMIFYKELIKPIPPDNAIGRLTRMEAISNKSINEAALGEAKHTLSRLERALKMTDDPDFGLCRVCEEMIPFARLMIMPESDLCVQCAEKLTG